MLVDRRVCLVLTSSSLLRGSGNDFGNNQSHGLYCALKDTLVNTSRVGGHAMRIWLHVEGDNTPQWDTDGYVIGTDAAGSLISDMRAYLRAAQVRCLHLNGGPRQSRSC